MKHRYLFLLLITSIFAAQGCFSPFARKDIDSKTRSDSVYLIFPHLIQYRNAHDRATYFYYLGDLKTTVSSCDSLLKNISELINTNPSKSICLYLDSLKEETLALRHKAIDEINERGWETHVNALLDSIARNHVVEEKIEIVYNWRTKHWLDHFQHRGRRTFQRWLERVAKYRDIIEPILVENNISRDFLYLAVIESGLNPRARSYAKAVGPWQFLAGTGRTFNLRINWWIDERRDIIASTHAAAHYLKHLHNLFGDWQLALAAYNSGQYRVAYAISRQKTRNYWRLRLPDQTRWFVPKFMAALTIGRSPEKYGFKKPTEAPLKFDLIEVKKSTDLRLIAKAANCTFTHIKKLNPALKRWATPPNMSIRLKVPEGKGLKVLKELSGIDPSQRVSWHRHLIKSGETISTIASLYDISQSELIRINKIRTPRLIRVGQTLMVPVKETADNLTAGTHSPYLEVPDLPDRIRIKKKSAPSNHKKIIYKVKPGDNLSEIAEIFEADLKDLRSWNNLEYSSLIKPGRKLSIFVPPGFIPLEGNNGKIKMIYIVKEGDTLSSISSKYGTSITDILKWNTNIEKNKLYPGNRLTIFVDPVHGSSLSETK